MTFDEYMANLPRGISQVKHLILKTLWEAGDSFPREWVRSSTLLELTGQKYFDRRTRELRDQLGCDIHTEPYDGEHCYRLATAKLSQYNPRLYLTATQKNQLFIKDECQCQICGTQVPPGVKGLQADHKMPLIRGGSHNDHNWQSICNVCNVAKRRACADCEDDCRQCPWAFPEKTGVVTLVRIPLHLTQKINHLGIKDQKEIEKFIIKAVENMLTKG